MNGTRTIDERDTGVPLPRLYLRPDEAARAIGISRRTLSEWQSSASLASDGLAARFSFPSRTSKRPLTVIALLQLASRNRVTNQLDRNDDLATYGP